MNHSIKFAGRAWVVTTSLGTLDLSWSTWATYGEALAVWSSLHGEV